MFATSEYEAAAAGVAGCASARRCIVPAAMLPVVMVTTASAVATLPDERSCMHEG